MNEQGELGFEVEHFIYNLADDLAEAMPDLGIWQLESCTC